MAKRNVDNVETRLDGRFVNGEMIWDGWSLGAAVRSCWKRYYNMLIRVIVLTIENFKSTKHARLAWKGNILLIFYTQNWNSIASNIRIASSVA